MVRWSSVSSLSLLVISRLCLNQCQVMLEQKHQHLRLERLRSAGIRILSLRSRGILLRRDVLRKLRRGYTATHVEATQTCASIDGMLAHLACRVPPVFSTRSRLVRTICLSALCQRLVSQSRLRAHLVPARHPCPISCDARYTLTLSVFLY